MRQAPHGQTLTLPLLMAVVKTASTFSHGNNNNLSKKRASIYFAPKVRIFLFFISPLSSHTRHLLMAIFTLTFEADINSFLAQRRR